MTGLHRGLAFAVLALALVVALWGGLSAARDRGPGRGLVLAVIGLSAAVSVTAVVGLALLSDHRPANRSLHLLYGGAGVAFVPIALVYAREATPRWRSGILAIAGLAIAIVAWRQFSTGGG